MKPPAVVSAGPAVFGVGINTISRRSQSVAGRLVQVGASHVGSRTISGRSHSVAGRLVQAGAGPALVWFAHAGSAGGPLCVEGRLVQVCRRAGASHFGSRTISRRSHSVAGRPGQGRHWSGLLTQNQQAVPVVWRDGWSRPALVRFARVGSAGGPLCVAGRLVQGWCWWGWLTHDQQAVQFCGRTAGPGRGRAGTSQV